MIVRIFLSVFLACASSVALQCQTDSETKNSTSGWLDKFVIDGSVNAQFGDFTLIGGNPQIGYRITDNVVAGAGYSYFFSRVQIQGTSFTERLHGPTAFARVVVTDNLFARSDYQRLIFARGNNGDSASDVFNRDRLFVGGGYRQRLGSRAFLTAGMFIDLLDPIARPVFRGGIESSFGNW